MSFIFVELFIITILTDLTAHSASAPPTRAVPPLSLMAGEPPANPLSDKKEIRRGEISEKCKGGGWWGAARLAVLGGVATSALCTKMGSSEFKKSLQSDTQIAPSGLFCFN